METVNRTPELAAWHQHLQGLPEKELARDFKQFIATYIPWGPLNPFSGDQRTFLTVMCDFIRLVGKRDYDRLLRVALAHVVNLDNSVHLDYNPSYVSEQFHKALRQVDVFRLGKGRADSVLYSLLNLPEASAFWELFDDFFFTCNAQESLSRQRAGSARR